MTQQDPRLNIEDGSYFREGRKWYSLKYVALISERVIYIIITMLALLILIASVVGILRLLPLTPPVPFTYISRDGVGTLAHIESLENEWGEASDVSLRRYFCEEYVRRREGYNIRKLNANVLYIYNHSNEVTARNFRDYMDKSNPRSPLVMYQSRIERRVTVDEVIVTPLGDNKYEAVVDFSAILVRDGGYEQTYHRAQLQFDYTDIKYEHTDEDTINGKPLKISPMTFKVTEYSAKQRK